MKPYFTHDDHHGGFQPKRNKNHLGNWTHDECLGSPSRDADFIGWRWGLGTGSLFSSWDDATAQLRLKTAALLFLNCLRFPLDITLLPISVSLLLCPCTFHFILKSPPDAQPGTVSRSPFKLLFGTQSLVYSRSWVNVSWTNFNLITKYASLYHCFCLIMASSSWSPHQGIKSFILLGQQVHFCLLLAKNLG